VVRKNVGYHRYDTDAEYAALAEVYRLLCPLINFWCPTIKTPGKIKLENGRYKKSGRKSQRRRINGSWSPLTFRRKTALLLNRQKADTFLASLERFSTRFLV
jgi:hypothetical protein